MSVKTKINAIPGICFEGKRKIAELLTELADSMGHKLTFELPEVGQVWLVNSGRIVLVSGKNEDKEGNPIHLEESNLKTWKGITMEDSNREDTGYLGFPVDGQDLFADYWLVKIADNLEDYYSNRVARLAAIKEMSGYAK